MPKDATLKQVRIIPNILASAPPSLRVSFTDNTHSEMRFPSDLTRDQLADVFREFAEEIRRGV